MRATFSIIVLCFGVLGVFGAPQDISMFFVKNYQNSPVKNDEVVKRSINELNELPEQLKQIPLQFVIDNIEQSIFKTVSSISNVANDKNANVFAVKPETDSTITKRFAKEDESALTTQEGKKILLQTAEKVPEKGNIPAHILVDRITLQPLHGYIPLIPAFEFQHTQSTSVPEHTDSKLNHDIKSDTIIPASPADIKQNLESLDQVTSEKPIDKATTSKVMIASITTNTPATTKDSTSTQATSITNTPPSTTDSTSTQATSITNNPPSTTDSTSTQATSITNTPPSTTDSTSTQLTSSEISTTTKAPITQLKEAEVELKEKVAEIEAEPIILSARV